jgi:hypothetical protein
MLWLNFARIPLPSSHAEQICLTIRVLELHPTTPANPLRFVASCGNTTIRSVAAGDRVLKPCARNSVPFGPATVLQTLTVLCGSSNSRHPLRTEEPTRRSR